MTLATYTFLPWLRRGLSGRIETPAGAGASRATLSASFSVASETGRRDLTPVTVSLIGPGDVAGVQPQQIIRTEPQAGVTDFEANYLAAIDFYDEDFPWRYSPVSPDAASHRLPPWIVLVVLKAEEFTRAGAGGQPLASFTLTAAAHRPDIFPAIDQEWAWAHVHVNAALGGANSVPDLAALGATLAANQDVAYARLLSPRKLDPNCGYTAFLVPAFEVGRRAGLGETIADTDDGTVRSWQGAADEFPIYFEWSFRTGVDGDFESLVRALVPRDMDPRVGIRDLDIARPGFGVATATNPPDNLVGLEGALLAPPIYGCWHAQVDQVSAASGAGGWVNTLNLDPRYRAGAGIGARVIRDNQERYVRIAWEQIGDVIKANQKIRLAQLATKAAFAAYAKSFAPLPQDRAVALASPVFTKVLGSPTTLAAMVRSSSLPRTAVSVALRKRLRPRGAVARRFVPVGDRVNSTARMLDGIGSGRISAAPPRAAAGGATLEQTTQVVTGSETPPSTGTVPSGGGWTQYAWLILIVILAVIGLLFVAPILAVIAAFLGAVAIGILVSRGSSGPAAPPPPPVEPPSGVAAILSSAGLAASGVAATPPRPAYAFAGATTDGTLPPGTAAGAVPMVPGDNAADWRRPASAGADPTGSASGDPKLANFKELTDRIDAAANDFTVAGKALKDALAALAPLRGAFDSDPGTAADPGWPPALDTVRDALFALAPFGMPEAVPVDGLTVSPSLIDSLLRQADAIVAAVDARLARAAELRATAFTDPLPSGEPDRTNEIARRRGVLRQNYMDAAKSLLGANFCIVPLFKSDPAQASELQQALAAPVVGDAITVEEWLHSAARVRPRLADLTWAMAGARWIDRAIGDPVVAQLPYQAGAPWIGGTFTSDLPLGEWLSLLIVGAATAGGLQAGLVIDDWTETAPADQETTGVAFNFNRPNAVAPQALLVAVAPVLRGHWTWDDLVGSVHEALDLAKLRAVEPDRLFGRAPTGQATDGAYFQALPAILMEFTQGCLVATDFAEQAVAAQTRT